MNKQVKKIYDFVKGLEDFYYSKTTRGKASQEDLVQGLSFQRVRCFIEEMTAKELRERLKLFEKNEKTCPVYEANRTCEGCKYYTDGSLCNYIERKVDYLFEKDMVILPCKVGDIVWRIVDASDEATEESRCEKEIKEFLVRSISVSCNSKGIWTKKIRAFELKNGKTTKHQYNIELLDIGRTVFFTREEAEQALKGCDE